MPARRPAGLPLLPGPLIGRRRELAAARRAILLGGYRLLTLSGPPGVGKTSLAIALAHSLQDRFSQGATLVDLGPVADPDLVGAAIAESLAVPVGRGRPGERLIAFLGERERLLLLDNFEQVIEASPLVASLLAACPNLRVVVTSRVPLRLRWEHELSVEPLELPDARVSSLEALAEVPAIRLYVERARAVAADFELTAQNARLVAAICARLDGLPLAIELAAARTRSLPLQTILLQLADQEPAAQTAALELLAGGPRDLPARQQTLRSAIRWSYALLSPAEQDGLCRLAVFADGCTFEAAEAVGEISWETLGSLVEKNLLWREDTQEVEPRFRMLETIQQFAREQLVAGGRADAARAAQAAYFLDLAEQSAPELVGPPQELWLERLERDCENLRAVLRWAASQRDAAMIARLGAALWRFWLVRSSAEEMRQQVRMLAEAARLQPGDLLRMRALHGAGVLARHLADYQTARALLEESLATARTLADEPGLAAALQDLGWVDRYEGRFQQAGALLEESLALFRRLDDWVGLAGTLRLLGYLRWLEGDYAVARALSEEGLTLARQAGDRHTVANILANLGLCRRFEGDPVAAQALFEEALAACRALGDRTGVSMLLDNLGDVALLQGDLASARAHQRAGLALAREVGDRRRMALSLGCVAALAAADDQPERALRLLAVAERAGRETGTPLAPVFEAANEPLLREAARRLGPTLAERARAAGASLPLERAVDDTLTWLAGQDRPGQPERPAPPAPELDLDALLPAPPDPRPASLLTRRERDVAALLGRGLTNRQIAEALVITEGTAANYVQRVLHRLDLRTRSQVAAWSVEHGLHRLEVANP
jgi:predicted ATPase/DNA-binding CsgD family transcriptional regulator